MKQVALRMGSGELSVKDVPPPVLKHGSVLVSVRASLISSGTERGKLRTARQSLLGKARSRPDQVRQVLAKLKERGLRETIDVVRNRLSRDEPLGYSCAGEVLAVGTGVPGIRPGDRVACAGAGDANHAEVVVVPHHLCVPVPAAVSWEYAAFVTVGAIALHAVRQADVRLGDRVLIVGLGLVGQLAAQLVDASGGIPYGLDPNADLAEVSGRSGIRESIHDPADLPSLRTRVTDGVGFDAVIVAAGDGGGSAFNHATEATRDRGRVIVVGGIGIDVPNSIKSHLFEREIEVRFARSYGPGRYDPAYEIDGQDYPIGYVRWTEGRNLGAVLEAIDMGRLNPRHLVTDRFDIEDAADAYARLATPGPEPVLGVLLEYSRPDDVRLQPVVSVPARPVRGPITIGVIGAGNFAQANLLPHLSSDDRVTLKSLVTGSGLSSDQVRTGFGFAEAHGDPEAVLQDPDIKAVVIATRHDRHADLVCAALEAGKHVFVEKPLAVSRAELDRVMVAQADSDRTLTVGFNRRWSPMVRHLVEQTKTKRVGMILYRINAGPLAHDSWYGRGSQGGRFVGEGGHFIDTACVLAASPVVSVFAADADAVPDSPQMQASLVATLTHANGAASTIAYLSNGDPSLPKERLEVFGDGESWVLDDFASLHRHTAHRRHRVSVSAGKGHAEEVTGWIDALAAGTPLGPPDPVHVTDVTLAIVESLAMGAAVTVRTGG